MLILAAFAWAMCFQGTRGLWEPDEGRYTAVALEMLRTGDWLHPQLNDARPHYTKPPVTYWALAASFKAFGVNEWAARLPNALAYAGAIVGVWVLGRRLAPGRETLAAVVYATTAGPFVAANVVSTDTLLNGWETWAMAGVAIAWTAGGNERTRQLGLLLAGVMFGLAFETKGPPGLLPLGGVVLAALWVRGGRGLRSVFSIAGVLAFLVIASAWFAAVILDRPPLLHYFLKDEVVARVASGEHKRNGEWYGWLWIYLPTIVGGSLPWTHVWGIVLWKRLRLAWRRGPRSLLRGRGDRDGVGRLLGLWVLVPLTVLCVAQSRMHLYALPLLVPLALIVTRNLPANPLRDRTPRRVLAAWAVGLLVFKFGLAFASTDKDSRAYADMLPPPVEGLRQTLFVDARPKFALAAYGYGSVEEVELYPSDDGDPAATTDDDDDAPGAVGRGMRTMVQAAASSPPGRPTFAIVRKNQMPEAGPILDAAGLEWRELKVIGDKVCLLVKSQLPVAEAESFSIHAPPPTNVTISTASPSSSGRS